MFQDDGEIAPYCNKKLTIEFGEIGRSVFGKNLAKGELLIAGTAIATGPSVQHLVENLMVKLIQMPLSTTL